MYLAFQLIQLALSGLVLSLHVQVGLADLVELWVQAEIVWVGGLGEFFEGGEVFGLGLERHFLL